MIIARQHALLKNSEPKSRQEKSYCDQFAMSDENKGRMLKYVPSFYHLSWMPGLAFRLDFYSELHHILDMDM